MKTWPVYAMMRGGLQAHEVGGQVVHDRIVLQKLSHVGPTGSILKLKHDPAAVRAVAVGVGTDDARVPGGGDRPLAGDPRDAVDDVNVIQQQQIAAERDVRVPGPPEQVLDGRPHLRVRQLAAGTAGIDVRQAAQGPFARCAACTSWFAGSVGNW